MTERRCSSISQRGSSFREHRGSVQRRESRASYYDNDENMPESVLERRTSIKTSDKSGALPNLVGLSASDNVYLITPEIRTSCRKWLIVPYIILYMAAYQSSFAVFAQYVYKRVMNDMFPDSDSFNHTSFCFTNKSDPGFEKQTRVQQRASEWTMYFSMAGGIPAVIASSILGSASDQFGRKFLFFLPLIGAFVRIVLCSFGIYYNFNLYLFLIGFVLEGMTGYIATMLQVCFEYAADTTPPKGNKRSFAITIIELFIGLALTIASFSTGLFIQITGFFYPMMAAGIMIVLAIVIIIFLPESLPKEKRSVNSVCDQLKVSSSLFFGSSNKGRRWMYIILMTIFFLGAFPIFSRSGIETLYLLDAPFCWTPEKIGYYSSAKSLAQNALGMGMIKLLQKVMVDESIAMLGCVSQGANFVIQGLAQTDSLMYIGAVVGVVGPLTIPMSRSLMSKLTNPEQQGAIFSAIASIEVIVNVGSSVVANEIYSATVGFYRGFVFFVLAGCCAINFICAGIYKFGSRRTFPTPLDIRR